jgi:hypothetical protein
MNTAKQGWGITIETAIDPEPRYPHPDIHGQKTEFNEIKNNIIANCRILLALANDWVNMHDHVFDNNCYSVDNGKFVVYDGRIEDFRTLEEWQASAGNPDSHSLGSNPILTKPSEGNFRLEADSPLIDSGINVNLTVDFEGNKVPYGGRVDVGAFEWMGLDRRPPEPPQNVKIKVNN